MNDVIMDVFELDLLEFINEEFFLLLDGLDDFLCFFVENIRVIFFRKDFFLFFNLFFGLWEFERI